VTNLRLAAHEGEDDSIHEIKERLLPVFKAAPVYSAVLFGSYARGEATDKSDVDIVIDSKGELLDFNFYGVLENAVVALGKDIDMIEISEIRSGSAILEDIRKDGVLLYEREG
jgi:predicted nucleotidyltransferase